MNLKDGTSIMKTLPARKNTRLKNYDYSNDGYYFITICTKNKQKLFSQIVETPSINYPNIKLTPIGQCVAETIEKANKGTVRIDKYVIMPNHIHIIIEIRRELPVNILEQREHGIPEIIRQIKTFSSKRINELRKRNGYEPFPTNGIWQKSYHDHIIRNDEDYRRIWQYIDDNPAKWKEDRYYVSSIEGGVR